MRCVAPESEPTDISQKATKDTATRTTEKVNPIKSIDSLEISISVERLSLVLIRVKTSNKIEIAQRNESAKVTDGDVRECSYFGATAERLATITLLGAQFQSKDSKLNE